MSKDSKSDSEEIHKCLCEAIVYLAGARDAASRMGNQNMYSLILNLISDTQNVHKLLLKQIFT